MTLTLRYAARSDRGLIRAGNQDSVYAGPRLLAVADGMGGMAAGDVASNIVIAALAHLDEDVPGHAPLDALRAAVESANQQIRDAVDSNPAMEGMGTTLTGMLFGGSKLGLVHIGDSRAYLLRDGELTQITRDDTYVQLLVDEGRISPEEANTHPQRSLLMRALDGRDADPEYSVRQAVPGDRYLLCSDGLSGVVSDETIAGTMREYHDPNQCAERLVQLALRGGGPDNITVILADVTDEDIVEESPVVGGAAATDRGMATSADASTPAARASALNAPRSAAPPNGSANGRDEDADRPRRHPLRTALILIILAGLLSGGVWAFWRYTQSHYYVGVTDEGVVAVFQGIPGQIAGFDLSTVDYLSSTSIDELTPVAQQKVREGISAASEDEAREQLAKLLDPENRNMKPICPTPTPTPSSVLTPTVPVGTVGPDGSGSPSPSPSVQPTTPGPTTTPDCRPAN
ncbi:MAG: PP2C family protein-serine/threonine phosphatase [Micromonosporaceae bacterium]